MRSLLLQVAVVGALAFAGGAGAGPAPQYEYEFVSYPGADVTRLVGVRSDGVAFGEFTVLEENPGPIFPDPNAILDFGLFAYSGGGNGGQFHTVEIPKLEDARLQGVNDEGVIWGYAGEDFESFVSGPDGVVHVDHPNYDGAAVAGVDRQGLIYGTRFNDDPDANPNALVQLAIDPGPFVSDGKHFDDLVLPGVNEPSVSGARGDFIWGNDGDVRAFVFDGTSAIYLDPPGEETFTLILGVSDDGLVVVNQFTGTSNVFLFDGSDYQPLDVPGSVFEHVSGMNGQGVFWGQSDLGAFIATPVSVVPEPGTAVLFVAGLALASRRWTRSRPRSKS
jgi:hypothetical protein